MTQLVVHKLQVSLQGLLCQITTCLIHFYVSTCNHLYPIFLFTSEGQVSEFVPSEWHGPAFPILAIPHHYNFTLTLFVFLFYLLVCWRGSVPRAICKWPGGQLQSRLFTFFICSSFHAHFFQIICPQILRENTSGEKNQQQLLGAREVKRVSF